MEASRQNKRGGGGSRGRGRGRGGRRGRGGGRREQQQQRQHYHHHHHHQQQQQQEHGAKTNKEDGHRHHHGNVDFRGGRQKRRIHDLRTQLNRAADSGDIVETEQVFAQLLQNGDLPTVVTMNILAKSYARGGAPERGYQLLNGMIQGYPEGYGILPNEGTFNAVIAGFAEKNNLTSAWNTLNWQKSLGFGIHDSFCIILRCTPSRLVLQLLQSGVMSYGIIMNSKTLNTALVAVLEKPSRPQFDHMESVIQFARLMGVDLNNKGCSLILNAYKRAKRDSDALQFYERFVQGGRLPDLKLVTDVINLYLAQDPPLMEKAEDMLMRIRSEYSLLPDIVVYNSMIKGYGRTKPPQADKVLELYEDIKNLESNGSLKPTEYTFAGIANVLCLVGRVEDAEDIIRTGMEQRGLAPGAVHYNILMKGYSRCRCKITSGYCSCTICTCSDPERALALLREMEGKGLSCDLLTLQNLLDAFSSAAQISEAMGVVKEIMKRDSPESLLRPTISMYNIILRGICVKHNLQTAATGSGTSHCGAGAVGHAREHHQLNLSIQTESATTTTAKRSSTPDDDDDNDGLIDERTMEALDDDDNRTHQQQQQQKNLPNPSLKDSVFEEINLVLELINEAGLNVDDVTCNTIVGIHCSFGDVMDAFDYLQRNIPSYRRAKNVLIGFNIVLNGCANDLYKTRFAPQPSQLQGFVNSIIETMLEHGIDPDSVTLNTIVKVFCEHQLVQEAENYIDILGTDDEKYPRAVPNGTTFATLIHTYLKLNMREDAKRVVQLSEDQYKVTLLTSVRKLVVD